MFSTASEKKIRYVRGLLAFLWLVLITSLFWDPITSILTHPDSTWSPFRVILDQPTYVQGKALPKDTEGYPMGARMFWTMLIPIVPFFLMFFGHEAWRRICPLSFMTQIPQYLGLQIKRKNFNRRTGLVEKNLRLIKIESWLGRNFWLLQFSFLFLGISGRLVFINSDRITLAIFLLALICMAIVVGIVFGGKTWCNYICPISPVQKIYTEPRGLLESQAHHGDSMITQSMCRTYTKKNEQSACVGCISNCPDIDLERNYWESLFDRGRRLFYYGYYGLVLGFYTYYYLYAGNWRYYFSGDWTHEKSQLAQLFDPGFYINGQAYDFLPKIIAAPVSLALFIAASVTIFTLYEKAYAKIKAWRKKPVSKEQARHHTYMVAAFSTFNTFYFFGGRPNLNLLPPIPLAAVDITIIVVSTIWLWRNLGRSQTLYKRESLVSSLRRQLQKLQFNFKRILEGRSLEELNTDEVYILAKTLPGFTGEQKRQVYKDILRENLTTGKTDSAGSIDGLREVRQQMELSDEDHRSVLSELQLEMSSLLEWQQNSSQEEWQRLNQYRVSLEVIVYRLREQAIPVQEGLQRGDIANDINNLREAHGITSEEHSEILATLVGDNDLLLKQAQELLEKLKTETAKYYSLATQLPNSDRAHAKLLRSFLQRTRKSICAQLLNILSSLTENDEAFAIARSLYNVASVETKEILESGGRLSQGQTTQWKDLFSHNMLEVMLQKAPKFSRQGERNLIRPPKIEPKVIKVISAKDIKREMPDPSSVLISLIKENNPIPKAVALYALGQLHKQKARSIANGLVLTSSKTHWLVREVAENLLGINLNIGQQTQEILHVDIVQDGKPIGSRSFQKASILIGKDNTNDIILPAHNVAGVHAAIEKTESGYELAAVEGLHFNKEPKQKEKINLQKNDSFQIANYDLSISWSKSDLAGKSSKAHYHLIETDTMTRMLYLFGSHFFNHLSPEVLAELAHEAEMRNYRKNGVVCRRGQSSDKIYVVARGKVAVVIDRKIVDKVGPGSSIGEMGIFTGQPRSTDVVAIENETLMITIDGNDLTTIVEDNSKVAKSFLKVLSTRQQSILHKLGAKQAS